MFSKLIDLGAQQEFEDNFLCFKAEIPKFLVFSTKKVGIEIFGDLSSGIVAPQAQNLSKMDPKRYVRLLVYLGAPYGPTIDSSCTWDRSGV